MYTDTFSMICKGTNKIKVISGMIIQKTGLHRLFSVSDFLFMSEKVSSCGNNTSTTTND